MKNRLRVINGGLSYNTTQTSPESVTRRKTEPNFAILDRSPCLCCELFSRGKACTVSEECTKIEAFQRVAAAYRSLYRPVDTRSMG